MQMTRRAFMRLLTIPALSSPMTLVSSYLKGDVMTTVKASESTHLYSVQFVEQTEPQPSTSPNCWRVYMTAGGLRWMDDTDSVNPMLDVQDLTVRKASGSVGIGISGDANTYRALEWHTNDVLRWKLEATTGLETGGDVGTGIQLSCFHDDGSFNTFAWYVDRATGNMRIFHDLELEGAINHDGTTIGFYGATPITKPTITGVKGSSVALANLLTQLANLGLITNSTT